MTIYGKCGNVRIQAKIKGLIAILENNLWRNLWQSGIIYGREYTGLLQRPNIKKLIRV
jgi:hypothetical protein